MGMSLECMIYLQKKNYLSKEKNRLLDIGPQNIYYATNDQVKTFVSLQGAIVDDDKLKSEMERLVYFSTPRPEERTTLLSELTDLTNIEYNSFDVCPALKTEIIDLNFDFLPEHCREHYDVVLNFGTTEHVFNQWNSFEIMHDALKQGGVAYHQLPGTGYLDHGYFCYTPVFFEDLAKANGYEILDMFFTPAGLNEMDKFGFDVRDERDLLNPRSAHSFMEKVPCFNINVILRKIENAPFRCSLELATSHSAVNQAVLMKYNNTEVRETPLKALFEREKLSKKCDFLEQECDLLKREREILLRSRSWRLTSPLRAAGNIYRKLRGPIFAFWGSGR